MNSAEPPPLRRAFLRYLHGTAFRRFMRRALGPPRVWHPAALWSFLRAPSQMRRKLRALGDSGAPVLGFVLRRDLALEASRGVAPALVLGTFDFTPRGLETLFTTARRIKTALDDPASDLAETAAALSDDDSFRMFRRRPLDPAFNPAAATWLFDELLGGEDFPSVTMDHQEVPLPFVVLLAQPGASGLSASLRRDLAEFACAAAGIDPSAFFREQIAAPGTEAEAATTLASFPTVEEIETTASGNPVVRYLDRRKPFQVSTGSEELMVFVQEHIELHLGPIEAVFHEILSDQVHVDIYLVAPTENRPFHYLVTSGMSERPMRTPPGMEECAWAELCLALPPGWPLTEESFEDERNYWPLRWLKTLARFPHEYDTWLWWGHSLPNGDPPKPLGDSGFEGFVLLNPQLPPTEFLTLDVVGRGYQIHFLSLYPVFPGEMKLKLDQGAEALVSRFHAAGINECVQVTRKPVA